MTPSAATVLRQVILGCMVRLDEGGQQRDLRLIPPPEALRGQVEHFWIQESLPARVRRIVPDVHGHVIFSTRETGRGLVAECNLVGARSRFFDLNTNGRRITIGARLRPGALADLARDSAAQFMDQRTALADVVGRDGRALSDRMAESSPQESLNHLAQFLSTRLGSAVSLAADGLRESRSVEHLAQALDLSRRAVYSRVMAEVGLAPKLALRILRLQKSLFRLNHGRSLAEAAVEAGYCDQAHFSRETVCLLGETPAVWQRRGALTGSADPALTRLPCPDYI